MRRVDQHFVVEKKLNDYTESIVRLSAINRNALSSIQKLEQRLKDLQASFQRRDDEDASIFCLPNNFKSSDDAEPEIAESGSASSDSDLPNTAEAAATLDVNIHTQLPTRLEEALDITLADVTDNSFTLTWDSEKSNHLIGRILDVEIRYFCIINGVEKCVQQSCSRWVLRRPIPEGVVKITGLETNTECRDVSLRFMNHQGWSEFTSPINRICTSDLGKNSVSKAPLASHHSPLIFYLSK